MISPNKDLIGKGIYTADEAARYARITTRTMQRWVWGDASGEPVLRAELAGGGEPDKLVTFLDFVQAMAIRSVRVCDKKFPLPKIRSACDEAMARCSVRFPLASRDHGIFLFGPREKLHLCEMVILVGTDPDGLNQYVMASGKSRGNRVMTKIAEPFMQGIEFGSSEYAERYTAWSEGDRKILMDPHQRLGEPYLPSCGYTALALWEAYLSEGGTAEAAKAYDIDEEDVMMVCNYFDHLTGNNAA